MKLLKILIIISLPILVLLIALKFCAFDQNWYDQKFNQLGVYKDLGQERVDTQVQNLFQYLKGDENLLETYYSEKEIKHLQDVNNLFWLTKILTKILILFVGFGLIFIYLKKDSRVAYKTLFYSGLASLFFNIAIIFAVLVGFEKIFLIFHQILFTNNYWLLDPDVDFLIRIFPPELFSALAIKIFIYSILISLFIIISSKLFLMKKNHPKIIASS